MKQIHLEGFGVVGCGLAWLLASRQVPFTWSDTNSAVTAWRACTGAIYPAAAPRDREGYAGWQSWFSDPPWTLTDLVERADYWYCTKNPPHGGREQPTGLWLPKFDVKVGRPLRRHALPSFHFNAQRFVDETRVRFADLRRTEAGLTDTVVVSHGFNARRRRFVWGWSAYVRIESALPASQVPALRPSLYFRPNLVQMAYAYPVPHTAWWYAGSSLIVQKQWQSRPIPPKVLQWRRLFESIAGEAVRVVGEPQQLIEGWRPSFGGVEHEVNEPYWQWRDGQLVVLPMWHSGVRWLPGVWAALQKELTL